MSSTETQLDAVMAFWRGRTSVPGPRAARFHGGHDVYDLAAISRCAAYTKLGI